MKKLLLLSICYVANIYAAPKIVVTLKPLHSIVSQITDGIAEPELLIKQASPHGYQITTADAKALGEAQLIVWTGKDMETFMPDMLVKTQVPDINWSELKGLELLGTREGGVWAEHDHSHEGGEHHHGVNDLHLWLSTYNAEVLANNVAKKLQEIDPENTEKYKENFKKTKIALNKLYAEISKSTEAIQKKGFLVFHDAYQYFEHDYKLNAAGSVRVTPEHEANPRRLADLQKMLSDRDIKCVFKEPQFPAKVVDKLVNGTNVKVGTLDPLGADVPAGKDAYAQILRNLSRDLNACLQ